MRYKIVKDASLRESMRKNQENGEIRWKLYEALLTSSTYDEYMAKAGGIEQEFVSGKTGKAWKATADNCFKYVLRNGRIALIG